MPWRWRHLVLFPNSRTHQSTEGKRSLEGEGRNIQSIYPVSAYLLICRRSDDKLKTRRFYSRAQWLAIAEIWSESQELDFVINREHVGFPKQRMYSNIIQYFTKLIGYGQVWGNSVDKLQMASGFCWCHLVRAGPESRSHAHTPRQCQNILLLLQSSRISHIKL